MSHRLMLVILKTTFIDRNLKKHVYRSRLNDKRVFGIITYGGLVVTVWPTNDGDTVFHFQLASKFFLSCGLKGVPLVLIFLFKSRNVYLRWRDFALSTISK